MGKAGDVRATRICTLPGRHQEFHPGTYIYTSLARMLPFCQPSVQGGLGITGATATLTKAELLSKKGVQLYFYKTLKRKREKMYWVKNLYYQPERARILFFSRLKL